MNKVLVIGAAGSGKSVFSRALSEKTGLPLIHLDLVWHRPDRSHISREEFDAFLAQTFLKDQWILDGNYSRTLAVRFHHADTVFFLDYPIEVSLEGVRQRMGKSRPDMPWIEEQPDLAFEEYVSAYPCVERPAVLELVQRYKADKTIFIFKSRQEAEQYLAQIS